MKSRLTVAPQPRSIASGVGAALAVGSAVLHGVSITGGHHGAPAFLVLLMAAVCLSCAVDLWVTGTERAWVLVAAMNLAMIGLHLPMSAHPHGAIGTAAPTSTALTAATLLAVVEVLLATVVLGVRSRRYAPRVPDVR